MFLNGILLDFCKEPRNVHFDQNSVFSLFYKISFADLWSLFMEPITYKSLQSLLASRNIIERISPRSLRFSITMDTNVHYQTSAMLNQSELQFKSSANVIKLLDLDQHSIYDKSY